MMHVLLLFFSCFILLNFEVFAASANPITENERMFEEIETLKFRINELTRELALMKTAMMKVSSLEKNISGTQRLAADNYSFPSENNFRERRNTVNSQGKSKKTTVNPSKRPNEKKSNYLEIINDGKKKDISDNENLTKEKQGDMKKKKEKNKKSNSSLNIAYESKIEFNKPVVFNLLLRDLNFKNPVLSFSFSQFMMFNKSKSSSNIALSSNKHKAPAFIFNISDQGQSSTAKFCFTVSNLNALRTELYAFDDLNGNLTADNNEPLIRRFIEQTVLLED